MPPADGPLSGSILGRYRIGPLLGRGGMGEVYRGDDVELQRAVAIKVLPAAVSKSMLLCRGGVVRDAVLMTNFR